MFTVRKTVSFNMQRFMLERSRETQMYRVAQFHIYDNKKCISLIANCAIHSIRVLCSISQVQANLLICFHYSVMSILFSSLRQSLSSINLDNALSNGISWPIFCVAGSSRFRILTVRVSCSFAPTTRGPSVYVNY